MADCGRTQNRGHPPVAHVDLVLRGGDVAAEAAPTRAGGGAVVGGATLVPLRLAARGFSLFTTGCGCSMYENAYIGVIGSIWSLPPSGYAIAIFGSSPRFALRFKHGLFLVHLR